MSMIGTEEDKVTYPNFMKDRNDNLIFHYRDGVSSQENVIYTGFFQEMGSINSEFYLKNFEIGTTVITIWVTGTLNMEMGPFC